MVEQTAKESPLLPDEPGAFTFTIEPPTEPNLILMVPNPPAGVCFRMVNRGQVFLTIYMDGRCEVAEPLKASAKAFWELVNELHSLYFPGPVRPPCCS